MTSPVPPPAPPPTPHRGLSDLAVVALSIIATFGVLALVVALAAFAAGPVPERAAEADDEPRFEPVGEAIGPSVTEPDAPVEDAPAWCPEVDGLDGPSEVGHDLAPTGLEADLGTAEVCLYDDGEIVAARWEGRTVDDLEAAALDSDRFEAVDGEYAYTYYDGETQLGCATVETEDTVYGACGVLYTDDDLFDLHHAIKDAVG